MKESPKGALNYNDMVSIAQKFLIFAGPQIIVMLSDYQKALPEGSFWVGFGVSMAIYAIQLLLRGK